MNDNNPSSIKLFLKNKIVLFVLVADVVMIIAIIVLAIMNGLRTSVINLNVVPIDATISINGDASYKNGMYSVMPGSYEVTISHDSLEPKTFTIDVSPDYVATLTTFLSGVNGDLSFYELSDNYDSYLKLVEIASADRNITSDSDSSAESFIANREHILSISNILPLRGFVYAEPSVQASTAGFVIRDGRNMEECKKDACLLVNYYGTGIQSYVNDEIVEAGYNPEDYQIIYEKYD